MVDFAQVDYLAVILATVATMILGFLWYTPVLFGNTWMKQLGMKPEEMSGGGPLTYILTAVTAIVGVFVLVLLLTLGEETTAWSGLCIGLLIGIAVSAKIGMNYLFEGRKLGLYLITIGYHLVSFIISGIIIGAMQG
ncbi:DUF1761 domain-containing protein [Paenibacillus mendelii]|uniref:DUF1761 domain-containing protein n=1 Tax=Paenibacillus mendelii TaxID=206163 RepID=A0ABV6JLN0_9BACL|nr:DUF1761 domain-containing protein [Paenibacillus mendelii]MCQ6563233.1 DUF1761 domain-containing protein [Paenibacillus mendelii]